MDNLIQMLAGLRDMPDLPLDKGLRGTIADPGSFAVWLQAEATRVYQTARAGGQADGAATLTAQTFIAEQTTAYNAQIEKAKIEAAKAKVPGIFADLPPWVWIIFGVAGAAALLWPKEE